MNKVDAIWICRRIMKIWHPEFYGDLPAKQKYWTYFLDNLKEGGYISEEDCNTWKNPFK